MADIIPQPLRDDLKIRRQVLSNETWYVVKEPERQQYFRFDPGQYGMLELFDGHSSLSRLVSAFNAKSEEYEYDRDSAVALYNSAREYRLLRRTREEENAALVERLRETHKQRFLQRQGSLLFMRFHVYDPDALFDRIIDRIRFMWSPAVVHVCVGLMLLALVLVFVEHRRFASDFLEVSSYVFGSLTGLLTAWPLILVVIALHEFAHGLTCKNFGGEVHDMGFLLLVLINPCMYCNVNDAWLFENKRHKMYVVFAGVYFELLLGSLAVFVWFFTDVGALVGRLAFVVITVCISATVLFNLNPLMKLDGYYLLSDYMELPNLRQNSLSMLSWGLKRHLLRMPVDAPMEPSPRETRIFITYGAGMCLYLGTVFGKILSMGYGFARSKGFVAVLIFYWLVFRLFSKLLGSWPGTLKALVVRSFWKGGRRRFTVGALAVLAVILAVWSPRMRVYAPCEVGAQMIVVHAPESGFVTSVAYGQDRLPRCAPGDVLLALSSPDLELERRQLEARREAQELERRMAGLSGQGGALRRLAAREMALVAEARLLDARTSALAVRLPQGRWIVDGPPPRSLFGRHYAKGETVLSLIPRESRVADVIIDQTDLSYVAVGQEVRVLLPSGPVGTIAGVVQSIAEVGQKDGVTRRFDVRVHVPLAADGPEPPPGIGGMAVIMGEPRPLWQHVLRPLKRMTRYDLWL
ncbi:putative peptide zinc metalloprotease protein [Desulfobaculum xiamenense]|uniref:Putative peptide zinc metalloprotease protein n=1 Tax=Desulfobaculum xiamenense TaxID=995050 RepID=A0A846QHD7_9BACT|nr:HlyD family efflux transporter periplasmic adaptor subunit [Desulfobaculum xiamenense]NJB66530.1 putative peptide zinc metalloprotease protein [Desulfobaculum xiamenense]